jgi:hypothetical protein
MNLTVEILFSMPDDAVCSSVPNVFKEQLKSTSPVKEIFFPKASTPIPPSNPLLVKDIALALVGSAVAQCRLYSFNETVSGEKSKSYWENQLMSPEGAKESRYLYDKLFPDRCQENDISFSDFLKDASKDWGTLFLNSLVTDENVNQQVNKLISGEKNWNHQLNLLLYKLNCFDPKKRAIAQKVFQTKIPQFVLDFETCTYFNKGMLQQDMFNGVVAKAAAVVDSHYNPNFSPYGGGASTWSKQYGAALWDFIRKNMKPLGFTTGTSPKNQGFEYCTAYGCHTSMSRALKSSCAMVAMSDVKPGDQLIDGNGNAITVSNESSQIKTHGNLWIYGFNDIEPFFTGETAFKTPDGEWKSLLPDIANQINPNLKATLLKEGDEILHTVSTKPLKHEPIKIEKITESLLPMGSYVSRPLFNNVQTYHIEGFLTALNAPVFTPKRMQEALARLSDSEQKELLGGLQNLMPLLKKAIGSYIEAPIIAAFKNNSNT